MLEQATQKSTVPIPAVHNFSYFLLHRLWKRCGEGCSSGSSIPLDPEVPYFPGGCLPSVGGGSAGPSSGGFIPPAGGDGATAGGDAAGTAAAAGAEGLPSGGSIGRGGSLPNPRLSQSSNASQATSQVGLNKPGVGGAGTLASLAGLLGQQQQHHGSIGDAASSSPSLSQRGAAAAAAASSSEVPSLTSSLKKIPVPLEEKPFLPPGRARVR